jgi:Cytochrome c oxidase caa3 assembly factor (Caa3_CtaG)
VRQQHPTRPWPLLRTLPFLGGLAVAAIATQSSIVVYDDTLFSVHMVQHVMLIMAAPSLLTAGRPVTLLLHSWGNPVHTQLKRAVPSRLVTALTWPPFATVLYCAVVRDPHAALAARFVRADERRLDGPRPAVRGSQADLIAYNEYLQILNTSRSAAHVRPGAPSAGRPLTTAAGNTLPYLHGEQQTGQSTTAT